jgi:hypothetical protein
MSTEVYLWSCCIRSLVCIRLGGLSVRRPQTSESSLDDAGMGTDCKDYDICDKKSKEILMFKGRLTNGEDCGGAIMPPIAPY